MKRNTKSDEYKSVFGNVGKRDGATQGRASWAAANVGLLTKLIVTVTSRGGAIRLGYTRDGGAYAVGFYYGSESVTKYCRPTEDLSEFLAEWINFYEDLPDSNGVSPAGKQ